MNVPQILLGLFTRMTFLSCDNMSMSHACTGRKKALPPELQFFSEGSWQCAKALLCLEISNASFHPQQLNENFWMQRAGLLRTGSSLGAETLKCTHNAKKQSK